MPLDFLREMFESLNRLNEEAFELTDDGIEELKDFEEEDEDEVETVDVIDPEAEDEEDASSSAHVGQVICECKVCHSNIFLDKDDVEYNIESEVCNEDDECPYCGESGGFILVGEILPYKPEEEEKTEETEQAEETEETEETEEVKEGFSKCLVKDNEDLVINNTNSHGRVDNRKVGNKEDDTDYDDDVSDIDGVETEENESLKEGLLVEKDGNKVTGRGGLIDKASQALSKNKEKVLSNDVDDYVNEIYNMLSAKVFGYDVRSAGANTIIVSGEFSEEPRENVKDKLKEKKTWEDSFNRRAQGYVKRIKSKVAGIEKITYKVTMTGMSTAKFRIEVKLKKVIKEGLLGAGLGLGAAAAGAGALAAGTGSLVNAVKESDEKSSSPKLVPDSLINGGVNINLDASGQNNSVGFGGSNAKNEGFDKETGEVVEGLLPSLPGLPNLLGEDAEEEECDKEGCDEGLLGAGLGIGAAAAGAGALAAGAGNLVNAIKNEGADLDDEPTADEGLLPSLPGLPNLLGEDNEETCEDGECKEEGLLPSLPGLPNLLGEKKCTEAIETYGRPFDLTKGVDVILKDKTVVKHFDTETMEDAEKAYEEAKKMREEKPEKYSVRYFVVPEEVKEDEEELDEKMDDRYHSKYAGKSTKDCKEAIDSIDFRANGNKVSADDEKITIEKDAEGTEEDNIISPVSEETAEEIIGNAEEGASEEATEETAEPEEGSEEEVEVDEIQEESFNRLGTKFLKKTYENVQSFNLTSARADDRRLVLEGIITFKSGAKKSTSFMFESSCTKNGKLIFLGENKDICRGNRAFTIQGSMSNGKLITESMRYNYRAKTPSGKSVRVSGTVKNNED